MYLSLLLKIRFLERRRKEFKDALTSHASGEFIKIGLYALKNRQQAGLEKSSCTH